MKVRTMAGGYAVAAVMTFAGFGYAAAQPGEYSTLPVDPNLITDSLAYNALESDACQHVTSCRSHLLVRACAPAGCG
jgi:hypothetical protein